MNSDDYLRSSLLKKHKDDFDGLPANSDTLRKLPEEEMADCKPLAEGSPNGPIAYISKYQNNSLPASSIQTNVRLQNDSVTGYGLATEQKVTPLV